MGKPGEAKDRGQGERDAGRFEGSPVPLMSVAVAICAVSFSAILIRWSEAPPLAIAFYRMLFTVVLLSPFAVTTMRRELKERPLGSMELTQLVIIGIILSCHFALWITSLTLTTVASSVLLVTFHPVFVGVIGFYLLKETLSRTNVAGILIAILGTFVLLWGDLSPEGGDLLSQPMIIGDIMAFLGGLAAGTYILGGRYFRRARRGLITYVFIVYLACTISLFIMCLASGVPLAYPPREMGLFIVMALGPGILGHTLYNWTLRYVKAAVVSVSLLGEPIGSSILAFILLSEAPSSLTLVGGVAILAGIYLAAMGLEKKG